MDLNVCPFHHTLGTLCLAAHLVAEQIIGVISMAVAISNVTDAVLAEGGGSESMPTVAVNIGRDAAAEGERGEGVVVRQENDSVDELREGPAALLCLQKLLK